MRNKTNCPLCKKHLVVLDVNQVYVCCDNPNCRGMIHINNFNVSNFDNEDD